MDSWKVSRRLTLDYGLRFDHLGPWVDESGNGAAVFEPSLYNVNATGGGTSLTGFAWHKHQLIGSAQWSKRGVISSIIHALVSPTTSLETGKTVLRGGFGIYRYHDEQNVQAGAMSLSGGSYSYAPPNPAGGLPNI